jgi:hypothetical protein
VILIVGVIDGVIDIDGVTLVLGVAETGIDGEADNVG